MKITDVRAHVMNVPAADGRTPRRNWVFVEVETDAGITGIGEATTEHHEMAVAAQVETSLKPRLLGMNPMESDLSQSARLFTSPDRKGIRMKRRTPIFILALAGFFILANSLAAQTSDVAAGDVVDEETLKAFVLAAKAQLEGATTQSEYQDVLKAFRSEETWKKGSIYIGVLTTEGVSVFHAENPDLEGRDLIDLVDANGVKITHELLAAAARGGGYVRYLWPDPAVPDDEETGSPKVSYGVYFTAFGETFIVGSGFYPGSPDDDGPDLDSNAAILNVFLIRNGLPVAGATVELSRSISGRAPEYLWAGTTDGEGRATIRIRSGSSGSAPGYYRVRASDAEGNAIGRWGSIPINGGEETTVTLPVGGRAQRVIQDLVLHPNVPNPFNPSTQIAYGIPEAGHVTLAIYNTLGQQIRVLVRDHLPAGAYRATWDGKDMLGRDVSSGVYFYRLIHTSGVVTRRLLFVK